MANINGAAMANLELATGMDMTPAIVAAKAVPVSRPARLNSEILSELSTPICKLEISASLTSWGSGFDMTITAESRKAAGFDVGRIVGRVGEIVRSKGVFLLAGSILLAGLPTVASAWITPKLLSAAHLKPGLQFFFAQFAILEATGSIAAAFGALVTAWIALIMVRRFTGEGGDGLAVSAMDVARGSLPIGCVGLIYNACATLGAALLLIPGLYVMTAWCVATPAQVYEHRSIRLAFGRSLDLTRGRRLGVLGFLFALSVLEFVLNFGLQDVAAPGLSLVAAAQSPTWRFLISPLLGSFDHVITAAATASIYIELIELKQGGFRSAVLEVFD
jgi:hypothetical protein